MGVMSPKKTKVIEFIIERACFFSGDKSGDSYFEE